MKMKWKKRISKRPYILDCFYSKEIIYNAYRNGKINWNTYQKALERINSNMNGSWMFNQNKDEIYNIYTEEKYLAEE